MPIYIPLTAYQVMSIFVAMAGKVCSLPSHNLDKFLVMVQPLERGKANAKNQDHPQPRTRA